MQESRPLQLRHDPQRSSPSNRLSAICDGKFRVDITRVNLDRMQREIQPGSDLLVAQPFGDKLEDFALARAEWLGQRQGDGCHDPNKLTLSQLA